jgi:poly(3-hydroxybutyrate) depolymerase
MTRGNRIVSITDEGFGFGWVAYDDTVLDEPASCGGGVATTTSPVTGTTAATTATTTATGTSAFGGVTGVSPVVTGFSSGAYMANQLFVTHSSTFQGLGLASGGAYSSNNVLGFALGSIAPHATQAAFDADVVSKVPIMVAKARTVATQNKADAVSNMANKPVYVLHAADDGDVFQSLGQASIDFYTSISTTDGFPMSIGKDMGRIFGHALPDAAGEIEVMLKHLYPGIPTSAEGVNTPNTLTPFSQNQFCPNNNCAAAYMSDTGYYYVPDACVAGGCKVNMWIHGCGGSADLPGGGSSMVDSTGWTALADMYSFIMLFPQTSGITSHPEHADRGSCWNVGWYTNKLEATADGHLTNANPQIVALKAMIDNLTGAGGDVATTTGAATTAATTAGATTNASGVNCCNPNPCPTDADSCWNQLVIDCGPLVDIATTHNCPAA